MQKFKKHLAGILLIGIAVIGITASSASKDAKGASDYLLPSDFDPHNEVLLVEKAGSDGQVEEMKTYMSSNYPYKYEFVTWDDLNDDKYKDLNTYHFLIRKVVVNNGKTATYDYRIYDRLHNQNYSKSGDESNTPEKPFEKIVKKLTKKYQ